MKHNQSVTTAQCTATTAPGAVHKPKATSRIYSRIYALVFTATLIVSNVNAAEVVQLFYSGANNALFSRWRNPDGSWSGEQGLGGVLAGKPVAAVVPGTNTLQLFYRGSNNA